MCRRLLVPGAVLGVSLLILGGCAPTAAQQAAAFAPDHATLEARAYQSRRFDTGDQKLLQQAAIGALQDMGFTVEETQSKLGVIVASKILTRRVRAEVTLHPNELRTTTIMRATFQEIAVAPGAMLPHGVTVRDPLLYQGFFDKVSQSAFLTANGV